MSIAEWYEIVHKSRLVDDKALSSWRIDCKECLDARAIANRMSADGILTEWQAEKLLDGRWKGFFVDHYCIRKNLGPDNARRVLVVEAMDMRDQTITILEVVPPSRKLRDDGGLIYAIQSKE